MQRFPLVFVFELLFISYTRVCSGNAFELQFITWPNETQVVVNETVKFLWKYYAKNTDVDIKWGTAKSITPKVSTFDELFFYADKYEKDKNPIMSSEIPARYRDRVRIVGQASLQIINVTLEDEGDYLCEISDTGDGWRTLSRAAKLHVLVPPTIVSRPPDTQLLSEGEELRLGCKATGKPKPDVAWFKDSVELKEGAGSAEFLNPEVSRFDDGNYKCVARNNASEVEYTVQVIVRYKPAGTKIKTDAKSDTVEAGEDLKIVCEAHSKPKPTFKLYHRSKCGLNKQASEVQTSETGEFYIRNITSDQRGNYSCIPINDVGHGDQASVSVYVRFPPKIKKLTARKVNFTKTERLIISCDIEGYPAPKISWTKDGKVIGNEQIFKKDHLHETDQGTYTCVASNGIQPNASKTVDIIVFYKPIIDEKISRSEIPAQIGDKVELKCNASGNPTPSFEWKKGDLDGIAFKPTYNIKLSKPEDFGRYTCVVSNVIGTTIHFVRVFEVEKPVIEEIKVTNLESRSVHLAWKIGKNTKFPIIGQELLYFVEKQKEVGRLSLARSDRSHKLKHLTPYSKYIVRLKVWNRHFPSDQEEVKFQTATARPGPPGKPKIEFRHSTSVRVIWNPPIETNGMLKKYIVEYAVANDSRTTKNLSLSASGTHVDVENLIRGQLYRFKVRATTQAGKGDYSKETLFNMSFQAPSIPERPKVTTPSANVYRLVWDKPNVAGKLVKVLIALQWKVKHSGQSDREEKEIPVGRTVKSRTRRDASFDWKADLIDYGSKRVLDLTDLFPNTIYKVTVKESLEVKGEIFWSAETSTDVVTPEGVPSQPRGLTVDMLSDSSFLVSWKRPLYIGDGLQKYVIFCRTGNTRKEKELKNDLTNESLAIVVDGLNGKQYTVQVQASGDKPGLLSNNFEINQGSGLLKMSVDSLTKDSFTISWRKPSLIQINGYKIYYRAQDGKWETKDIRYGLNNNTLFAKVHGLSSGELYQVKVAIVEARKADGTDYVPILGGIIAGVLIFAFVIIIVAMFVKYKYRKQKQNQRRPLQQTRRTPKVLMTRENGHTHISSPSDHFSSDSPGSEKCLRPERKGNSVSVPLNVVSESTKPIPVSNLLEYCADHRKDGNKGFADEFKSIETGATYTYAECKKPVNKSKNRYANIVTYDHTRVCLSNLQENGSDYINANYIDGYNCPEKFIATQGPVASTFGDFWRMVWEQNCSAIVMVTNLIEKGKVKCQKYWPVTEAELFGSLVVNPIEEWELTDYTIRKFQLQQKNNSELTRDVTQFHYTAWPDHGVPVHPSRLLAFVKRVKNYTRVATGKIVVHCSAGVGRTGTFIALDALLDQMKVEGVVDIYKFVSQMRTQRNLMVQTEAQYSFIYEAVLEASICGDTEIPVPDYIEKLRTLERVESADENDLICKEFQSLRVVSVDEKETCVNGLMPENLKKNRYHSILPYDSNRVKLWPYPSEKGSDYINASFVDGYRNREIFIATQAPLKESVEDFWRMIWEYECYVLIMLNKEENEEFLQYWPSHGEEYSIFGLLMVEVESKQESDSHVQRILKCTNTKSGEIRKVYHLNYNKWVDHNVPISASSLLKFIKEVVKLEQRTGNGLTLLHCSDGSGRVGTFATIYVALERMKLESIIDVFSIVRNLRTQRIGMVETIEQYRFCYYTLEEHIKSSTDGQSY